MILAQFGEMTHSRKMSRRDAVTALAKEHKVRPNIVYDLIERAKKSVE
jgi:hypothetical protein